jgi:hypothetical protein
MRYHQEKKQKNGSILGNCEIELETNEDSIRFTGKYSSDYVKRSKKYNSTRKFEIVLNKNTGDITSSTSLHVMVDDELKINYTVKINDFDFLYRHIRDEFYCGSNILGYYWGNNHKKTVNGYFLKIKSEISEIFNGTYLDNKDYTDQHRLFDLFVDYHITKKGIKVHNNIYNDIQVCYPKKKWLKLNENKYVPAILDEYGIKTKYFITELSTNNEKINLRTLIYIAKLFGENTIDYIKEFDWKKFTVFGGTHTQYHTCRDESEKKSILSVFNNCGGNKQHVVRVIYDTFEIRDYLESKGCVDLKIKGKTFNDLGILLAKWNVVKKQTINGCKLKYVYPDEFINDIELPIVIDQQVFYPKLLLTEEDFAIEGIIMNNCMGTQFSSGIICQFISLLLDKKRVDIQYKDGKIVQSFAKANSVVPTEIFGGAISELTERMLSFKNIKPEKVKYDITDF